VPTDGPADVDFLDGPLLRYSHANLIHVRLLDYARNVYSQTGEDGVLEKVLDVIGGRDKWCVEFGAWDGIHLSNTRHLISTFGYRAVLIEADRERFRELENNCAGLESLQLVNRVIGFEADDGLDEILQQTDVPEDFDLLSIDIDGNDYHVLAGVRSYRPKVVCIEFNPTIPTEVDFVQPPNPRMAQGASLKAMCRLAAAKGYELVAVTKFNAIFVRSDFFPRFGIGDNRPATLREDTALITHLFCGYDGTVFISGNGTMPFHALKYEYLIAQPPRVFRYFPDAFTPFMRGLFKLYKAFQLIRRKVIPGAVCLRNGGASGGPNKGAHNRLASYTISK
jgi:hypothetical protein